MTVVHVQQPRGSKLCGHSVLAMVRGLSLERAVEIISHRHGTRTRELVSALDGHALHTRLTVIGRRALLGLPDPCVLKVCWEEKSRSHYVLRSGTFVHDPTFPIPLDLLYWAGWVSKMEGRITSFLPVRIA